MTSPIISTKRDQHGRIEVRLPSGSAVLKLLMFVGDEIAECELTQGEALALSEALKKAASFMPEGTSH